MSVQTLAAMIMNFDDEDIVEYEEMVGALTGMRTYTYALEKLHLSI